MQFRILVENTVAVAVMSLGTRTVDSVCSMWGLWGFGNRMYPASALTLGHCRGFAYKSTCKISTLEISGKLITSSAMSQWSLAGREISGFEHVGPLPSPPISQALPSELFTKVPTQMTFSDYFSADSLSLQISSSCMAACLTILTCLM